MFTFPAIHKSFSLLISPNDMVKYDIYIFVPFYGPNIISDGPTNGLSICQFLGGYTKNVIDSSTTVNHDHL